MTSKVPRAGPYVGTPKSPPPSDSSTERVRSAAQRAICHAPAPSAGRQPHTLNGATQPSPASRRNPSLSRTPKPDNSAPSQKWIHAMTAQYRTTHGIEPSKEVLAVLWTQMIHLSPPPQASAETPDELQQRIIDHEARRSRNPDSQRLATLVRRYLEQHASCVSPGALRLPTCRSYGSLASSEPGTPTRGVKAGTPGLWYA